jgi:hypothetical protein
MLGLILRKFEYTATRLPSQKGGGEGDRSRGVMEGEGADVVPARYWCLNVPTHPRLNDDKGFPLLQKIRKEWTRAKGGGGGGGGLGLSRAGRSRSGSLELAVTPHLVAARTGTTSQPATQECLRTEPGL